MSVLRALIIIVINILTHTFGGLYPATPQEEIVYGRPVKFCSYQSLRFLPDSTFTDYDNCMQCNCTEHGMDCKQMVGKIVGFVGDSACEPVQIACQNIWIMKNEVAKTCPDSQIPRIVRVSWY